MSPRAAWRLESLGFTRVYDYVAGMNDWSARRLPVEGHLAHMPKAGDAMDGDVATFGPDANARQARDELARSQLSYGIVTNEQGVVLGRLRAKDVGDGAGSVADVMEAGPTTSRPDEALEELVARMRDRHVESMIVTDPDGVLMGIMTRERAEALLSAAAHSA